MLDKYVNAVMNKMSGVITRVQARRDELERQRGSDRHAQSYLGTTLKHPEGHTSPLRKSAERAQQEYSTLRAEWSETGPQMLTLLASLMIARERRDETKAVWERHDAEEQKRVATKYHPEVRRLFAQLYDHGVRPAMLDLLRPETIGVLADLILWDASDRDQTDLDSPLPEIFATYAHRTMIMPGGSHTVTRSVSGVAPAPGRYTDPVYYRFGDAAGSEGKMIEECPRSKDRVEGQDALVSDVGLIPLASWAELPRQFAGFELVEAESGFMPWDLPPFTDIAKFTPDGRRPAARESRRDTIMAWSAIIEKWADRHEQELPSMQQAAWAMLLAHHIDNDASNVSNLNRIELASPWEAGGSVRIVVLPPPEA